MNSMNIVCPHCKTPVEISDAIQLQIEDELRRAKTEQSETMRSEYDTRTALAVSNAISEANQAADLRFAKERHAAKMELEKARQSTELEVQKTKQAVELEAEMLRRQAMSSRENEQQLRTQLSAVLEELGKANTARENAMLTARKEVLEKEKLIRKEAEEQASENFNTKIREQEETINKLREQLTSAKQVAERGSQQLQGEILEMDVEKSLRSHFPFDTIEEVRKGERGSDIRQTVNEPTYQHCGLILWECKNAKTYQESWLGKLRDELAAEKAQIGVIVFNPSSGGGDDFRQLADNVWLVKPRHVAILATLLREVCSRVATANRNAEGKDIKAEMIYNYLTGSEFANRIRYIIESYDEMTEQLATEKKQAHKRWAAQEKILEKITRSLYGISGDIQGIAGKEIIALPEFTDTGDGQNL